MAAKTLQRPTSKAPSIRDRFTGDATAGKLRQIIINENTRHILIRVVDSVGAPMGFEIADTGTDGNSIGTTLFHSVSGEAYRQAIGNGNARILGGISLYVTGDDANPTIETISSLSA